jgi:putative flippase GtrA
VTEAGFSDAQCGFKAMRTDVARQLLPLAQSDRWFFDTELLLLAEQHRLRIAEVAVDYVDDADSRVAVTGTAKECLAGVARMTRESFRSRRGRVGPVAGFGAIGVASILAHLGLFAALEPEVDPLAANLVAFSASMLVNTVANRLLTMRDRASQRWRRDRAQAWAAYAGGLALTSLVVTATDTGSGATLVALATADGLVLAVRGLLLSAWVFGVRSPVAPAGPGRVTGPG